MFFTYTVSVILLSLAIYGAWSFFNDIWEWILDTRIARTPNASFLVLVKNIASDIECIMRFLAREIEMAGAEYDAVIVDCGSDDLTPAILARLTGEYPVLRVVNMSGHTRDLGDVLPLCRGGIIHLLDLQARISEEEFMTAVSALLRRGKREVVIRKD